MSNEPSRSRSKFPSIGLYTSLVLVVFFIVLLPQLENGWLAKAALIATLASIVWYLYELKNRLPR